MNKQLVGGMQLDSSTAPDPVCEPCIAGKFTCGPIPRMALHRANQPLELVHSDVKGPLPVQTPEGHCYWVLFIDDYTRFWVVYLLKHKSEVLDAFKQYKALAESHLHAHILALCDDKGGEYMSTEFDQLLAESGIHCQHTVHNEPHQNGVAE